VDTLRFDRHSAEEFKQKTRAHWGASPCGSNYATAEPTSPAYFEEIERHRYATHPWILRAIRGFGLSGKKVLEIGTGMGTDHINLARQQAHLHGVDLTPRHLEITRERLRSQQLVSGLAHADAEELPFPDDTFDFVYSFGVVHHSPDTVRAVSEIRRVLRPGGRCWITVYHKHSLFFWWSVFLVNHLAAGGWRRRSLREQLSLIEYPNDNPNLVIRLYTRRQLRALFRSFSSCSVSVQHLLPADLNLISFCFRQPERPRRALTALGRLCGWYAIADAVK